MAYNLSELNISKCTILCIELPAFFIKLLSLKNGLVLDPFSGSGTTGIAAIQLNRRALLIDNQKHYCDLAQQRLSQESFLTPIFAGPLTVIIDAGIYCYLF